MAVSIADTKYGDSQVSSTSAKEHNDGVGGADVLRTQSAVTGKELLQRIKQETKCLQHFRGWTVSEDDQIRSLCGNHKDLRELDLSGRGRTDRHPWDVFLRMASGRSKIKQLHSPKCFPAHNTH